MRTTSRGRAGLLLASSLLSACAAQYVSPEDPTLLVPDLSAAIAVGQASRAEVRAVLGTPRHVLEFSAKYLDGSASLNLACQPGEVTYLVIQATAQKGFWRQALVDWRFERSDTMPARHARRALVVVDDGQWQVDP